MGVCWVGEEECGVLMCVLGGGGRTCVCWVVEGECVSAFRRSSDDD